jgi:hypothetical protein
MNKVSNAFQEKWNQPKIIRSETTYVAEAIEKEGSPERRDSKLKTKVSEIISANNTIKAFQAHRKSGDIIGASSSDGGKLFAEFINQSLSNFQISQTTTPEKIENFPEHSLSLLPESFLSKIGKRDSDRLAASIFQISNKSHLLSEAALTDKPEGRPSHIPDIEKSHAKSERLSDILKRVEAEKDDKSKIDHSHIAEPIEEKNSKANDSVLSEKTKKVLSTFLDTNTNSLLRKLKTFKDQENQELSKSHHSAMSSSAIDNSRDRDSRDRDMVSPPKSIFRKSVLTAGTLKLLQGLDKQQNPDERKTPTPQPAEQPEEVAENIAERESVKSNPVLAFLRESMGINPKESTESLDMRSKSILKMMQRATNSQKFVDRMETFVERCKKLLVDDTFKEMMEIFYEGKANVGKGISILTNLGNNRKDKWSQYFLKRLRKNLKNYHETHLANEYSEHWKKIKSFSQMKLYAIRSRDKRDHNEKADFHYTLKTEEKAFLQLRTFGQFQQNWIAEIKDALTNLKQKVKFDAWKRFSNYHKHKRLAKHLYLKKKFDKFTKATQITKHASDVKVNNFQYENLAKKVFRSLASNNQNNKEKAIKTGAAYSHVANSLIKKYFALLKPAYLKPDYGKKNFDQFKDFIPLQISIKDKVSKLTIKDKNVAMVSSNKTIVIDYVKQRTK